MTAIIVYALANGAFFKVSQHGLWLGCIDRTERAGYTCIAYFDQHTLGM